MKAYLSKLRRFFGKNKSLLLGIGATLLIAVPITAYIAHPKANNSSPVLAPTNNAALKQTTEQNKSIETEPTAPKPSVNQPIAPTNQTSKTGSTSDGTSTSPPTPAPSTPSTLSNCVFVGGTHDGENCPASVPNSWSYSTPCQANGAGAACPPYTQTGWITASYANGASYCEFSFRGDGNPTNAQSKVVRVSNGGSATLPDCSTAYPGV